MLRKKDKEIREDIKVVKRKVGIFQLWPFPPVLCIEKYATLDYRPSPRKFLCSFYFDGFPKRSNHGDWEAQETSVEEEVSGIHRSQWGRGGLIFYNVAFTLNIFFSTYLVYHFIITRSPVFVTWLVLGYCKLTLVDWLRETTRAFRLCRLCTSYKSYLIERNYLTKWLDPY